MATLTKPPSSSSKERTAPAVQPPINLEKWIEENRERFKPPVSNRYLYDGRDFFVMVIKGPNARNDRRMFRMRPSVHQTPSASWSNDAVRRENMSM